MVTPSFHSPPLAVGFCDLASFHFCPLGVPAGHCRAQPGRGRGSPAGHDAPRHLPPRPVLRLLPAQGAAEVLLRLRAGNECTEKSVVETGLVLVT